MEAKIYLRCCLFQVDNIGEVDEAWGTLICVGLPMRILSQKKTGSKDILAQSTHILLRVGLQQVSNKLWPANLIQSLKAKHSCQVCMELG